MEDEEDPVRILTKWEQLCKLPAIALKLAEPKCLYEEVKPSVTPCFSGCWRSQHEPDFGSTEPVQEQVLLCEGSSLQALHRDAFTASHPACNSKGTAETFCHFLLGLLKVVY